MAIQPALKVPTTTLLFTNRNRAQCSKYNPMKLITSSNSISNKMYQALISIEKGMQSMQ